MVSRREILKAAAAVAVAPLVVPMTATYGDPVPLGPAVIKNLDAKWRYVPLPKRPGQVCGGYKRVEVRHEKPADV